MTEYLKRSWAVVDLDNITHNANAIKRTLSPRCMLMGVVKADAYGHGDRYVAGELERIGVDWFGVSNIAEAVSLRAKGISRPILIFGATPCAYAKALSDNNLTQSLHSAAYAKDLQEAAEAARVVIDVHIKLDTGMSRLGFLLDDDCKESSIKEITRLSRHPNLRAHGIYTHFACADEADGDSITYTKTQFTRFMEAVSELEKNSVHFDIRHCCNSAGTVLYPEAHLDMVRPGILLYGLSPGSGCAGIIDVRPAMELYSVVSMVKEVAEGTAVSYGRRYTAHCKTKVATVPIGYADGFGRELSNKARMLVRGKPANVIGRVCMDQLMLDVTDIEGVAEGDIVTVIGGGDIPLTFDDMAELSGTISYEKVCHIGRRVPRVYRSGGKEIGAVDYILNDRF